MQKSPRFKKAVTAAFGSPTAMTTPLEPTRAPIAGRSDEIDQTKEAIRG